MATNYEKSLTEIVQNLITSIHDVLPNVDTKEGTFIRDVFINPISDEFSAMYGDMQLLKLSQSVLTAVGNDLDALAANYFIVRKSATKSYGKIRFYIKNTDKPISKLKDADLPDELVISIGTIVSTLDSYTQEAIQFQTTESSYKTRDDLKSLPIDASTGFRFIEVPAESISTGSINNVGTGEIVSQVTNINPAIAFISNPFAFSSGTDYESDAGLMNRVRLAITGSNIGTKYGYLSYVLGQDGVIDAKVIGAGDTIMFRDGGVILPDKTYKKGSGGMVDIYIRGYQNMEETWNFVVTNDYLNGTKPYKDIILPQQPVNNIVSIISSLTGEAFVNAADFEIEKSVIHDLIDPAITTVDVKYCKDILWDFSITDTFPDTLYYPLPPNLTSDQIKALKLAVDNELNNALLYMTNMNYGLDWATVGMQQGDDASTELFQKLYHNNEVYKIAAKDNTLLDGRMFIKKNDNIYCRAYPQGRLQPDYILKKDVTAVAGSIAATDSIKWLTTNKLYLDDNLMIKYNYDYIINSIQTGIEAKRCLTADVLIKQAEKVPLEIIADITCYPYVTIADLKTALTNDIINWLDNLQTLGGYFDRSDIVAIIKQRPEVDSVDLDKITIAVKGFSPKTRIDCIDNQYFVTENLVLNITYNNVITM